MEEHDTEPLFLEDASFFCGDVLFFSDHIKEEFSETLFVIIFAPNRVQFEIPGVNIVYIMFWVKIIEISNT